MVELNVGTEVPFVASKGVTIGGFRTGAAEWGWFAGISGGALGNHVGAGIGGSFEAGVGAILEGALDRIRAGLGFTFSPSFRRGG